MGKSPEVGLRDIVQCKIESKGIELHMLVLVLISGTLLSHVIILAMQFIPPGVNLHLEIWNLYNYTIGAHICCTLHFNEKIIIAITPRQYMKIYFISTFCYFNNTSVLKNLFLCLCIHLHNIYTSTIHMQAQDVFLQWN